MLGSDGSASRAASAHKGGTVNKRANEDVCRGSVGAAVSEMSSSLSSPVSYLVRFGINSRRSANGVEPLRVVGSWVACSFEYPTPSDRSRHSKDDHSGGSKPFGVVSASGGSARPVVYCPAPYSEKAVGSHGVLFTECPAWPASSL